MSDRGIYRGNRSFILGTFTNTYGTIAFRDFKDSTSTNTLFTSRNGDKIIKTPLSTITKAKEDFLKEYDTIDNNNKADFKKITT